MNKEVFSRSIINNMLSVLSLAVKFSPHPNTAVQDLNGTLRTYTGSEYPFFNGVFNNPKNQSTSIKDNLLENAKFFSERNSSFVWWWLDQRDLSKEMKDELQANQYEFVGEMSGIAVELSKLKPIVISDKYEVKKVSKPEEYNKFSDIICEAFELTENIKKDLHAIYKSYGDGGYFQHYMAYDAGKPVAVLTTYVDGEVVGIYNCATIPSARKKGLCSILTHYALQDAIDSKCKYAIAQLMPSAMARGLFEQMGFKTYCRFLPFLKNPLRKY